MGLAWQAFTVLYSDKQMQLLVTAGRIPHASLRSLRSLRARDSAAREGSGDKKGDARGEQPVGLDINQQQAVEQCGGREEARDEGQQGALDKLGQALLALREAWLAEGGDPEQLPAALWTGVP